MAVAHNYCINHNWRGNRRKRRLEKKMQTEKINRSIDLHTTKKKGESSGWKWCIRRGAQSRNLVRCGKVTQALHSPELSSSWERWFLIFSKIDNNLKWCQESRPHTIGLGPSSQKCLIEWLFQGQLKTERSRRVSIKQCDLVNCIRKSYFSFKFLRKSVHAIAKENNIEILC